MELGLGFLIGAFAGFVVVGIVAMLLKVSRRVVRAAPPPATESAPRATAVPSARTSGKAAVSPTAAAAEGSSPVSASAASQRSGHTMIVEKVEERDHLLSQNIQEVRDLLLTLAQVIGSTESASGAATKVFTSARTAIDGVQLGDSAELAEAQGILVAEIDRVLKSNADLHSELDKANQGIAEQRRQIEELRVQARVDGLTRIANRAAFDERLKEYISLLDRAQLAFTLLLIDIDFFKRVNDTHGHINGDRILRGMAAKITAGIRGNDFAARYGGEEFAVIFPATPKDEAYQVADRMRQDIGKTNFRLDDRNIRMTISGGIAESRPGQTGEAIIAAADAALYSAKNGGRNRIVIDGAPDGAASAAPEAGTK